MHPDIAQAVAQARLDDLYRTAERQRLVRLARQSAPRRGRPFAEVFRTVAAGVAAARARTVPEQRPAAACCIA